MKKTKGKTAGILWIEASGFLFLILISWLSEALRFPLYVFDDTSTPNWHRALARTAVLLAIWLWVHLLTRRLLKRLHHLEEYLRICSWCRKVEHDSEWMPMENYFNSKFATKTSHGMCPECLQKKKDELMSKEESALTPAP